MSEVSETLRAARKLIEKPENWCKGQNARNAAGEKVLACSVDATRWCIVGAMRNVGATFDGPQRKAYQALLDVLDPTASLRVVPDFNDHPDTTHAMVLDLFDRAIAMVEADG